MAFKHCSFKQKTSFFTNNYSWLSSVFAVCWNREQTNNRMKRYVFPFQFWLFRWYLLAFLFISDVSANHQVDRTPVFDDTNRCYKTTKNRLLSNAATEEKHDVFSTTQTTMKIIKHCFHRKSNKNFFLEKKTNFLSNCESQLCQRKKDGEKKSRKYG